MEHLIKMIQQYDSVSDEKKSNLIRINGKGDGHLNGYEGGGSGDGESNGSIDGDGTSYSEMSRGNGWGVGNRDDRGDGYGSKVGFEDNHRWVR